MKRFGRLIPYIAAAFVASPFFVRDGVTFQHIAVVRRTPRPLDSVNVYGAEKSRPHTQTGGAEAQYETALPSFHSGLFGRPSPFLSLETAPVVVSEEHRGLFSSIKSAVLRNLFTWLGRTKQRLSTSSMKYRRWACRTMAAVAFFCLIHSSVLAPASAAGSSGRMGGSFGSSGRVSSGRVSSGRVSSGRMYSTPRSSSYSPSPRIRNYQRYGPPIRVFYRPPVFPALHDHQGSRNQEETTTVTSEDGTTTTIVRRQRHSGVSASVPQLLLVVGAATCVAYAIGRVSSDDTGPDDSPLGPGVSVVSLTACLNVPDRNDPTNILSRLQSLADTSDTGSRRGLQRLMANASLDLLRQEKAVVSAESHFEHMTSPKQAERQFRYISTQKRSKFDGESRSNFGGETKVRADDASTGSSTSSGPPADATMALVCINLAIEGDSLRKSFGSNIKTRKDLTDALTKLSSDVQVEDCLMSADVIWSPEDLTDQLRLEDVYADFPTLYTLLD